MFKSILKKYKQLKYNKKKVKVGKNSRILTNYLNFGTEPYLIKIGNNCTITSGVRFITHDGSIDVPFNLANKSRWLKGEKFEKLGRIAIKDNCFIGINSIIMPGVTINENSIVAAGSVVTKDVQPGIIVGGNPAKVIGNIEKYCEKIEGQIILIDHKDRNQSILKKLTTKK